MSTYISHPCEQLYGGLRFFHTCGSVATIAVFKCLLHGKARALLKAILLVRELCGSRIAALRVRNLGNPLLLCPPPLLLSLQAGNAEQKAAGGKQAS